MLTNMPFVDMDILDTLGDWKEPRGNEDIHQREIRASFAL